MLRPSILTMPVTLDEVKAHLNVDFTDDDQLITGYMAAAVAYVEDHCGIITARRTLLWQQGVWTDPICIPLMGVREVSGVSYTDKDGVVHVLSGPNAWTVWEVGTSTEVRLGDIAEPELANAPNAVRVTLEAGYDLPGESESYGPCPPQVIQAILLLIAHFYEHREAATEKAQTIVPLAVKSLLDQVRVYR